MYIQIGFCKAFVFQCVAPSKLNVLAGKAKLDRYATRYKCTALDKAQSARATGRASVVHCRQHGGEDRPHVICVPKPRRRCRRHRGSSSSRCRRPYDMDGLSASNDLIAPVAVTLVLLDDSLVGVFFLCFCFYFKCVLHGIYGDERNEYRRSVLAHVACECGPQNAEACSRNVTVDNV